MPIDTFGVDGAVLYADIMLPLYGMGVPFSIDPGIGLTSAGPDAAAVEAPGVSRPRRPPPSCSRPSACSAGTWAGRAALIGSAGAPYTVASYLIEGRPSKEHAHAKALLYGDEVLWHRLMEHPHRGHRPLPAGPGGRRRPGGAAVRLLDGRPGPARVRGLGAALQPPDLRGRAATGVPTIHFGTGTVGLLESMAEAGSDLVSVDWWFRWTRPGGGSAPARGSSTTSTRPCCWPPSRW